MKRNVGSVDRLLRIVIGLALMSWCLFFNGPVWALIGIVPLSTGLMHFCPAYTLLGINTCKAE